MVDIAHYSCTCAQGFANGVCTYEFLLPYKLQCNVYQDGNCDVDADECASNPCYGTNPCLESSQPPSEGAPPVAGHAYRCTCADGFANGWCDYDFIEVARRQCTVQHSLFDSEYDGNCDQDVD